MKNKTLNYLLHLFIILFLLVIFSFSLINIFTAKIFSISSFDFVSQLFESKQSFDQRDLGHQIGTQEPGSGSHEFGTIFKTSSSDFNNNSQNYLTLGPQILLIPGNYQVSFSLAGRNLPSDSEIAAIDVFTIDKGVIAEDKILTSELKNDLQKLVLNFETGGGKGFEFRVYYLGKGELEAGKIELVRKNINSRLFFSKIYSFVLRQF